MTHLDEEKFPTQEKPTEDISGETRVELRSTIQQEVQQTKLPHHRTTHEINSSLFKSDVEIDRLFKDIDSLTLEQIEQLSSLLANSLNRPEYKDEELKNECTQLIACISEIESLIDRKAAISEFKAVLAQTKDLHKKFHAPERSLRYE